MKSAVLIVEDEPAIRELLQVTLEDEGYGVAAASDGLEALAQVDRDLPCLILLDLMLPHMDGATFLAELARRGLWPGIPVIVLSAAAGADSWATEIRAEGYLGKPFDLATVLEAVDRITAAESLALAS
jgi:CheY-like chemotaxis protein